MSPVHVRYHGGPYDVDSVPPAPEPEPPSDAFTDLPGWDLVFADTFDYEVALGDFLDGATDHGSLGILTADGRYMMRRPEWRDTSGHGTRGDGSIVEVTGGKMLQHVYTDSSGFGHNCILGPMAAGSTTKGGLPGMRFHMRFKGPSLWGHKSVPLLWPDAQLGSDPPNKLGEIDMAEASWTKTPKAYMHSADGSATWRQAIVNYPSGTTLQVAHDWVVEWLPGVSVKYYVDAVLAGTVLDGGTYGGVVIQVPTATMHPVMQFETSLDGQYPVPNTSGVIEIESVALWVPA